MSYDNYFAGGSPMGSPEYVNAMGRGQGPQPMSSPPMTMAEWMAYLNSLTPEQLGEIKYKGPDFDSGNPLEKIMGMFGKKKTAEGG